MTFRLTAIASVVSWACVFAGAVVTWLNYEEDEEFYLGTEFVPDPPTMSLLTLLVLASLAMTLTVVAGLSGLWWLSSRPTPVHAAHVDSSNA